MADSSAAKTTHGTGLETEQRPEKDMSIHTDSSHAPAGPIEPAQTQTEKPTDASTAAPVSKSDTAASTTVYPHGMKLVSIVVALMLTVFCVALDNTIIATAIPRITDDFHAINDVGYLLTNCAFQLLYGRIYTFFPLKTVYLTALAIFEIGSVVCGAAPNSTALIVGRAVSGFGASGLFSGAVVILSAAVPLSKRPMFIGVISSMFGVASVVGPLMGGAFTDHVTWRLCFYINLPLGLISAVGILLFFSSPPRARELAPTLRGRLAQFDPIGTLLFVPGIICLLLALQWGGTTYAWSDGRIIALFVLFGILFIAFIADQIYMGENATVPPRIITSARDIPFCMLWGFCLGSAFFTFVYFLPIYFQAIKADSATNSGVHTLPMLLAQVFASIVGGIIISKVGYYLPNMLVSLVFTTTGAGLLTTLVPTTSVGRWVGYQIIYGIGNGLGFQLAILIAQTALARADIPTGSAMMMFCQMLGGALFVSVGQNTFSNALVKNLRAAVPGIDVDAVLLSGATGFIRTVQGENLVPALEAYNGAIVKAFRVALIMTCLTLLGLLGQKLRSVKARKPAAVEPEAQKEKVEMEEAEVEASRPAA